MKMHTKLIYTLQQTLRAAPNKRLSQAFPELQGRAVIRAEILADELDKYLENYKKAHAALEKAYLDDVKKAPTEKERQAILAKAQKSKEAKNIDEIFAQEQEVKFDNEKRKFIIGVLERVGAEVIIHRNEYIKLCKLFGMNQWK